MALPGVRDDAAHQLGYRLADAIIAPWPDWADVLRGGERRGARRRIAVGAISRFEGRAAGRAPARRGDRAAGACWSCPGGAGRSSRSTSSPPPRRATPGWDVDRARPARQPLGRRPVAAAVRRRRRRHPRGPERDRRRRGRAAPGGVVPQTAPVRRAGHDGRARCDAAGLAVVCPRWPAANVGRRCSSEPSQLGGDGLGALEHAGRRRPRRRAHSDALRAANVTGSDPFSAHRGDHDRGRAPRASRPRSGRRSTPVALRARRGGDGRRRGGAAAARCSATAPTSSACPARRAGCRSRGRATPARGTRSRRAPSCSCSSTSTASPAPDLLARYAAAAAGGARAARAGPSPTSRPRRPAATPRPACDALARPAPRSPRPARGRRAQPAATTRCSGRSRSRSRATPGGGSAGSARTTSATAARTPTSASSPRRAGVGLAWVGGAWAYHQHHPTRVAAGPAPRRHPAQRRDLPPPLGLVADGGLADARSPSGASWASRAGAGNAPLTR